MPNNEYFQANPTRLDVSRSKMTLTPRWTGSWQTGKLVPIFASSSIMPGDTVKMDVSAAIRTITPKFPVMDDMDITIEAFFVPHRLVLSRKSMSPDVNDSNHSWAAFIGAQDSLLNMPTPGSVELPRLYVGSYSNGSSDPYNVGGLADCLGFSRPQVGANAVASYTVNPLKPLAYYSIWNEYFRDPNTMSPVTYTIGNNGSYDCIEFTGLDAGVGHSTYGAYHIQQFTLAPVCRYHGYFGSALPWPQRNLNQVELPLGQFAPVVSTSDLHDTTSALEPLHFRKTTDLGDASWSHVNTNQYGQTQANPDAGIGAAASIYPDNLWTDLSTATAATINQFREKVQEQRWYEALSRGGNKLEDLNYSMFGVRGPSVTSRPEYLGGVRIPISISQVANTAGGTASVQGQLSLGSTGAFSLTNLNNFLFTKSFTEHGTLMVVACCRVHDSFGQGIAREDTKFERFEYYWPQFANLGEQRIRGKELFVTGTALVDDSTFGYQEAWAEYRMIPDVVTGKCRPGQDLEFVTYVNNFGTLPSLKGFLSAEDQKNNVDKTLQVGLLAAGFQFYGQFQFGITMTRPMPLYSIPGLVDHH